MKKEILDYKREREILHNYMEFLAKNYEKIEPETMSDSIAKIYRSLNGPFHWIVFWTFGVLLINTVINFIVLIVKLFRRKTR